MPGAMVSLTNAGTNAKHSTLTGDTGSYQFVNLEVGTYQLTVEAVGFQKVEFKGFDLGGRETKRLDAQLQIASQTTTINVESSAGSVIETDTSSIAETKGSIEPIDLPVAITFALYRLHQRHVHADRAVGRANRRQWEHLCRRYLAEPAFP